MNTKMILQRTLSRGLLAAGFLIAAFVTNAPAEVSKADQNFMVTVAHDGIVELRLSVIAAEKGMRQDVKDFGHKMVKDHTAIDDNMKALALKKGVILPEKLDEKQKAMVDKMSFLRTGTEFDDAYIASMKKDHKKDVKAFKAIAAKTKDSDLKGFLDKTIPIIEMHSTIISAMK